MRSPRLSLIVIFGLWVTSCSRVDPAVVIHQGSLAISTNPTVLDCDKPLKLTREICAIYFVPKGEWKLIRPFTLAFADGQASSVNIAVIDKEGTKHLAKTYNQAFGLDQHALCASFSFLDKRTRIVQVEISASPQIVCTQVYWQCIDPM